MLQNCREGHVAARLFMVFVSVWSGFFWNLQAAVASRAAGQLVSWGTTVVPRIAADARFIAVATGDAHSVVVNAGGTVTGWGSSSPLQLGLSNVVAVAAGGSDTIALRADGTV